MDDANIVPAAFAEREPTPAPPRLLQRMGASSVADWVALLKPRVMMLVVFTGLVGLAVAPGHLDPVRVLVAVGSIAAGSGAAGAINMWYDRDIDAIMRRTARRPIPAGRIAASDALVFGIALASGAVVTMGIAINIPAAAGLAFSIAFYVFVYTIWLKRRTPQNIVVGGAAGAFPPVIGWMAVTGQPGLMPLLMFTMIFLWTPPHFWSLSLWTHGDYARAGVPMLPVVAGARQTRRQIFLYSVLLVCSSFLPWACGQSGVLYALSATLLGIGFVLGAWHVLNDRQDASGASRTGDVPARWLFRYSILYLSLLFAALAVDAFHG